MNYIIAGTQLITALVALAAFLQSLRNGRNIREVHVSINSRMDQLLELRGEASKAAGFKEGRETPVDTIVPSA